MVAQVQVCLTQAVSVCVPGLLRLAQAWGKCWGPQALLSHHAALRSQCGPCSGLMVLLISGVGWLLASRMVPGGLVECVHGMVTQCSSVSIRVQAQTGSGVRGQSVAGARCP